MSLDIATEKIGDKQVVVKLTGEIDQHSYAQLEETLAELVENGTVKLVLDLSAVTYISSAGIGTMAGAMSEVETEDGGAFVLFGLQPSVKEVFDTMGFSAVFNIEAERQKALEKAG